MLKEPLRPRLRILLIRGLYRPDPYFPARSFHTASSDKREPKRVGGRYRGLDSGNRRFEWIDQVILAFYRIFDGAIDQPRVRSEANGPRDIFRFIAETVLEVSGNWQISRVGQSCPQIRRSMLRAPCSRGLIGYARKPRQRHCR